MSIILKALKKIQDQQGAHSPGEQDAKIAAGEKAAKDSAFPVSLRGPLKGKRSPDAAEAIAADIDIERLTPHGLKAPRPTAHHRFGLGPKALLVLLVCLGVFTTGWFASRIYINMKFVSGLTAAEPQAYIELQAKSVEAENVVPPGEPIAPQPARMEAAPVPVKAGPPPESAPAPAAPSQFHVAGAPIAEPPPEEAVVVAAAVGPARTPPAVKEARPERKGRPEFKINAIAWKNAEPRAIVNMQSVYEGDMIEGATVLAIGRKIIVFQYEGETFEVRF